MHSPQTRFFSTQMYSNVLKCTFRVYFPPNVPSNVHPNVIYLQFPTTTTEKPVIFFNVRHKNVYICMKMNIFVHLYTFALPKKPGLRNVHAGYIWEYIWKYI